MQVVTVKVADLLRERFLNSVPLRHNTDWYTMSWPQGPWISLKILPSEKEWRPQERKLNEEKQVKGRDSRLLDLQIDFLNIAAK